MKHCRRDNWRKVKKKNWNQYDIFDKLWFVFCYDLRKDKIEK